MEADILDVVKKHVELRRSGMCHVGLCPFHKEYTPSFTVSASKQQFHCFGCGASGNVKGFLKNIKGRLQ